MDAPFILWLRNDVRLMDQPGRELRITADSRPTLGLTFKKVTPALRSVFDRLMSGGATEDQLNESVLEQEGTGALFVLTQFLRTLENAKLLCRTLEHEGRPIATLVPIAERFTFDPDRVSADTRYVSSRFAYARREGTRLVVESPLGYAQLGLESAEAAAMWTCFSTPCDVAQLARAVPSLPEQVAADFLTLVVNGSMLTPVDQHGCPEEDAGETLPQWDFHDLQFHSRSRLGRHANPFGAQYRFQGRIAPLPGVKPPMSSDRIVLPRPDLARLAESDPSLTTVLESRRSVREHGEQPIAIDQLGEFLYRSARVIEQIPTDKGDVGRRPYPAGGAIYELEMYAVVDRCEGLASGLYHYDPADHQLETLADRNRQVEALLKAAWYAADRRSPPQVVLVLTARFQRMQWKYQSMVYAAVLKHVGVVYQTWYLVATAMGLAPCGLGGGDAELFGEVAGLDYYAESSVGEFILGTREADRVGSRFEQ
jgi:SagB-type dehydrogenase family enzyme